MSESKTKIYRYLDEKGLKHAKIGYKYLMTVIEIMMEDPTRSFKIMDMYEKVAELYGTQSYCVERAIRYAISQSSVTNKEFISKAIQDIAFSGSEMVH